MEQGQRQFYNYIIERVKEDRLEDAKMLLGDSFRKQSDGEFSRDDAVQFASKIEGLLKEDKVSEVRSVMQNFSQNMGR